LGQSEKQVTAARDSNLVDGPIIKGSEFVFKGVERFVSVFVSLLNGWEVLENSLNLGLDSPVTGGCILRLAYYFGNCPPAPDGFGNPSA
jgi:hypothetical protein